MDKKLAVRVFDTTGKMRGRHRLFDPLVESGYTTEQVEEVVSFCLENDLLDKSLY